MDNAIDAARRSPGVLATVSVRRMDPGRRRRTAWARRHFWRRLVRWRSLRSAAFTVLAGLVGTIGLLVLTRQIAAVIEGLG